MSAQHVLIVEDSLVYRRLLSRMLTQWGYIVSEAETASPRWRSWRTSPSAW